MKTKTLLHVPLGSTDPALRLLLRRAEANFYKGREFYLEARRVESGLPGSADEKHDVDKLWQDLNGRVIARRYFAQARETLRAFLEVDNAGVHSAASMEVIADVAKAIARLTRLEDRITGKVKEIHASRYL